MVANLVSIHKEYKRHFGPTQEDNKGKMSQNLRNQQDESLKQTMIQQM